MNYLVNNAAEPVANFVFAHGAGAGMEHEFLHTMAKALAGRGINVLRFDFPYMAEAKQQNRRRPPNPAKVLLAHFEQVLADLGEQLDAKLPLFIGGKSMGGRMASILLPDCQARGGICFGYPFHPPGKPEKLRTEHLQDMAKPLLIVQGERDTFGHQQEIASYGLSKQVNTRFLPDGDHSFKPRKASGHTQAQHIDTAAEWTATFIKEQLS
ncbi:alpha/beta hydrolase [Aestuariibacter halophilus]|uniref:Alpha/beta hydrolase n=1 Tax=Fluctibacter halophilus TaxID=226011 RepID=A0ABS8G7F3_9ALTE|nr:alpha/beta family hydrolase [Aestuariibacter halophilus]MCC2616011.1 alpha/beta hydrolase [Aestuariibacter halophilus]